MKWSCVFSLLFFIAEALAADPSMFFPHKVTPEKGIKKWQKIRVEGQDASYLRNPLRMIGYGIKATKKKFSAPKETVHYFSKQKEIFTALATQDKAKPVELSLEMTGDIMWLWRGWEKFMSPALLAHMQSNDVVLGNLETLISKSNKVPDFLPARATFNSPESILEEFRKSDGSNTFSALSVANNHSLDYGEKGFVETLKVLQKKAIPFSGAILAPFSTKRWTLLESKGFKIGFYAATYGMNNRWEEESKINFNLLRGMTPPSEKKDVDLTEVNSVLNEMQEAGVDIKVVSLHWGYEYEYYPEARQVKVAREIVKAGADIIMGHHSHSQQPLDICFVGGMESRYNLPKRSLGEWCTLSGVRARKALIVYGLGNFLTNMYSFLSEVGAILDVKFFRREDKSVDWHSPKLFLIYNQRKAPESGKRDTIFMDDYLKRNCDSKACDQDDLDQLNFLKGLYSFETFSLGPNS